MRTTQETLQVIAIKCGFFTVQSFDRNFKEKMGVTPLKWRKDTDYYQKRLENQHVVVFNGWK
jgi:AraC-like DNA-binding protein